MRIIEKYIDLIISLFYYYFKAKKNGDLIMDKYARFRYQPCIPMGADGRKLTGSPEHTALSRKAAGEGMVLLKNDDNALPLKKDEKVALFGKATIEYIKGGGGSGDVFCAYTHNIYDGFAQKEKESKISVYMPTVDFYKEYVKKESRKIPTRAEIEKTWDIVNAMDFCQKKDDIVYDTFASMHVVEAEAPDELISAAAENADTAIITLSRFSAEGVDRRAISGDYYLSDAEKSLIDRVSSAFKKTIVVLNSGGVVDCEHFAENDKVQGILCGWQGGMEGGMAVADILCGDVNPSGKLGDTIPKSYDCYENGKMFQTGYEHLDYEDDIYVGYRYFETIPGAAEKVRYPFGFGLSYTDFEMSGAFCGESEGKIVAVVTVKNIGKVSGKEVVQLYYSAPQGKLGKPSKELAAFAKTKLLAPGESQTVALSFDINDMASFDDLGKIQKSAFVLEKGTYKFSLGNSVRNTRLLDYEFTADGDIIVKQSKSLLKPFKLEKRLLADGSYETLPQSEPSYDSGKNNLADAKAPDEAVMFDYVGEKISLDDFIRQFTVDELIDFVGGHQNQPGVCNTGAFGGLKRLDIPPIPTADGPAGVRLNAKTGAPTTAWPCATLLACTWNTELIEEVGSAGGAELRENNLGVWLAPAMNIHRNPLCGRNFEYFSEDPLLAGKCCAADVRGIQSRKVAASVKHFACNNRESNRFECDSRVSERALREIYLRGFEICVREADPWTVMSSYNIINGCHTSTSYELLTEILKGEWGFKGMVTTDWGVHSHHSDEILAGNDLKMGEGEPNELKEAYENGKITRADLEACVRRILVMTINVAE